MAQSTIIEIPNQSLKTIRADLNEIIKASYTMWAGSIEPDPSPTGSNPKSAPYMWWNDTNNKIIKLRNASDTDWIELFDYSGLSDGNTIEKPKKSAPVIDLIPLSTGQVTFNVGEAFVPDSLRVFRDGYCLRAEYYTESDQIADPGQFILDSAYIAGYPFAEVSGSIVEKLTVFYEIYLS
ncbi:MAG: hypothetical protein ABIJ17_02520 [Patescibacteria group bacterium]